jgi:hypothetical protein
MSQHEIACGGARNRWNPKLNINYWVVGKLESYNIHWKLIKSVGCLTRKECNVGFLLLHMKIKILNMITI